MALKLNDLLLENGTLQLFCVQDIIMTIMQLLEKTELKIAIHNAFTENLSKIPKQNGWISVQENGI